MKYLLDSNVWIEAAGGVDHALRAIRLATEGEWAGYSAITRLELLGFPDLKPEEETQLLSLLKLFSEVAVTSAVVDRAIGIRRKRTVKIPDALIATTALVNGCALVTRNIDDFRGIDGLTLIDPVNMPEA